MIDAKAALTLADLLLRRNRERGLADDARTTEILDNTVGAPISDMARRMIELGRIRRGEIVPEPKFTNDESGRRARAIVNAGRRRRGEPEL